ncbi:hypothetical protein Tco_0737515 [Tanacetum coccineum]
MKPLNMKLPSIVLGDDVERLWNELARLGTSMKVLEACTFTLDVNFSWKYGLENREPLPEDILGVTIQRAIKEIQRDIGRYYPKRYWEILPKEILKRYWEILPKEILKRYWEIQPKEILERYWEILPKEILRDTTQRYIEDILGDTTQRDISMYLGNSISG